MFFLVVLDVLYIILHPKHTHTHIYIYYRDCWFLDALLQPSLDGYSMGTRSLGRPDFWEEVGD